MKHIRPDDLQRGASDPSKSVWVGASAGSGKTKVLVDRVLRLLLSGIAPQKILCLTFTRAAAAQMSIKVMERLSVWATCSDDKLREELDKLQNSPPDEKYLETARCLFARVLNCPGGMRIRTIHSFGQEVLRRFPIEAGLPPQFSVMEETDAKAMLADVKDDLLRLAAANPESPEGQALQLLVKEVSGDGFSSILEDTSLAAERLRLALSKHGGVEGISMRQRELLGLRDDENEENILSAAIDSENFKCAELKSAAKWLQEGTDAEKERGGALAYWLSLDKKTRMEKFEDYCGIFLKKDGFPRTKLVNKKVAETYPGIVEIMAGEAERLSAVQKLLDGVRIVEQTKAVLVLASKLNEKYAAEKTAKSVLDYDDLIIFTDNLLRREGIALWVMFKLDNGIDHILVDEAQDTSPAQWRIVDALTQEFFSGQTARSDVNRTLFVVGDEKQSIFSFLKADREKFTEMREYFKKRIVAADANAYREVPMNISFRSARAILRAVDAVFADDMAREGVSDAQIEHQAYRSDIVGRVEVWPIISSEKENDKEVYQWSLPDKNERDKKPAAELASKIADKIAKWLRDGEIIEDRALVPDDIMILVRKRDALVDNLVRALKSRNVQVTGVDRMTLVKQLPVMDLLALLQFVLLPEDDLNLAVVLKGPLLGLNDSHLMKIAIRREGALWQSLCAKASGNDELARAVDYLRKLLAVADKITPFAMLSEILSMPCPADDISGRKAVWSRLGPDALDPVDELLRAAQEFGQRHSPSLQSFLHWMSATETEIKREMDQNGGQVRITTVHAAKGLEAPIVILPDTTSLPSKGKMSKVIWDATHEVPFYVPREPLNVFAGELRDAEWQKQLEEYRRLLYVALTRAKYRLYVCGWKNSNSDKSERTWYDLIERSLEKLHEPSVVKGDEIIAFEDAPKFKKEKQKLKDAKENQEKIIIPAWAYQKFVPEAKEVRVLTPSHMADDDQPAATPGDQRFMRGRIIHRLLQSLPEIEPEKRDAAASRFLGSMKNEISIDRHDEIKSEVLGLLNNPEYAPLFGPESRAEAPIVWSDGIARIEGQMDRICVRDDSVWIVDYKTNRPPPDDITGVAKPYLRQMAAYAHALKDVYPGKVIRCFILWTYGPRIMPIPEDRLTFSS